MTSFLSKISNRLSVQWPEHSPDAREEYPDAPADRGALNSIGTQWLKSIEDTDFSQLPLSKHCQFSLNSIDVDLSSLPQHALHSHRIYIDEQKGQIAVYAKTGSGPYHARLRVTQGEVTEVESWLGTGFNFWKQGAPAQEPLDRNQLIAIVEAHLDAIETGIPYARYTKTMLRTENGQPFFGMPSSVGVLCALQMPFLGAVMKKVGDRRKVIDTKYNTAIAYLEFHYRGGIILPLCARLKVEGECIAEIEVIFDIKSLNRLVEWRI